MKIELEYNNYDIGGLTFEKKLTEKKIHLICTARLGGLSIFQEEVIKFRNNIIPLEKAISCLDTVNLNNETGTLFPLLNITILPLTKYFSRNSFGDKAKMKENILDCFNANELYVKCPIIIFAFDLQEDFEGDLALKTLKDILSYKDDFIHTKSIFCTNFINI